MKKTLKSIQKKYGMLNEGYAWERTPGKALPTLEDVQAKYDANSVTEQQKAAAGLGASGWGTPGWDGKSAPHSDDAMKVAIPKINHLTLEVSHLIKMIKNRVNTQMQRGNEGEVLLDIKNKLDSAIANAKTELAKKETEYKSFGK